MNLEILHMFNNLKINIEEINYVKVWPFWKEIVSVYPRNRLYLITEGTATIHLKNKTILLEPNNLYYIPAFSVVGGNCDIFGHYYCHFDIEAPFTHLTQFINFSHSVKADENDIGLFKQIMNSFPIDTPQKLLRAEGSFKLLFSKFFSNADTVNSQKLRFFKILNYIDENYNKEITLANLANEACLNEKYFCRLFKEYFDLSPWHYLIQVRLNKARSLLFEDKHNIKEIAHIVGFEDEFYFSRIFKKHFGTSPREYKLKIKQMYELYS